MTLIQRERRSGPHGDHDFKWIARDEQEMSKNDKTAIIDASILDDFTPDSWEDQPSTDADLVEKDDSISSIHQQTLVDQRVEILRNKDKANEIKPSIREREKEHLPIKDRMKRYNEARARIFNKDNKDSG